MSDSEQPQPARVLRSGPVFQRAPSKIPRRGRAKPISNQRLEKSVSLSDLASAEQRLEKAASLFDIPAQIKLKEFRSLFPHKVNKPCTV